MNDKTERLVFWNGNKTQARKKFELALLEACLAATSDTHPKIAVDIDDADYPSAEDEGNVFENGVDILVTVAGNTKFQHKDKIMIKQPLTKGLLGYRLLIVKDSSQAKFATLNTEQALQALSIGIPETWADAQLFRDNGYSVVEKGQFEDLFRQLKEGVFDYTALGVNEIEEAYQLRVKPLGDMSIQPTLMLYYPFPLVFYVHPNKPALAARVEAGLDLIMQSGAYEALFNQYHGDIVHRLQLKQRKVISLKNPVLPAEMADFTPTLLDE